MSQKTVIKNLLQSVTDCYYKVRQVLQNVTVITNVITPLMFSFITATEHRGAALSSFTLSEAAARGIL